MSKPIVVLSVGDQEFEPRDGQGHDTPEDRGCREPVPTDDPINIAAWQP